MNAAYLAVLTARGLVEAVIFFLNLIHLKNTRGLVSEYTRAKLRVALAYRVAVTAGAVMAVGAGLLPVLDEWWGFLEDSPVPRGLGFVATLALAAAALEVPFMLYQVLVVETRYGFNRQSLAGVAGDLGRSAALSAVFGGLVVACGIALVHHGGDLWWLSAFALFSLVQVGAAAMYPVVIAPLYNRFARTADESLTAAIEVLARAEGFPINGVYVMDGSRRSTHSNAYLAGFWRFRRVVLYDTLVADLSTDAIVAVVAHEIAHFKLRHPWRGLLLSTGLAGLTFFAAGRLADFPALYAGLGMERSAHALLVACGILGGGAGLVLRPLLLGFSRRNEFAADRFAARRVGGPLLAQALSTIYAKNLSHPNPHPLYRAFYHTHPTIDERVAALTGAG